MAGPMAYFASGNSRTTACAITCAAECRMTSRSLTVQARLSQRFAPLGDPLVERPAERFARDPREVVLVGAGHDALRAELVVETRERRAALLIDEHLDRDL